MRRFDADNLPPDDEFRAFRKTGVTLIAGPYDPPVEVVTREGVVLRSDGPTYLAIDACGQPYPVAADVFRRTYVVVSD